MPPPPMVPGKHNMDIGTWEGKGGMGKSSPASGAGAWSGAPRGAAPAYLRHPPPPPVILPPPPHPLPMHVAHSISHVEPEEKANLPCLKVSYYLSIKSKNKDYITVFFIFTNSFLTHMDMIYGLLS